MTDPIQVELKSDYYADYLKLIEKRLAKKWSLHGAHHRHLNGFIQKQVLALKSGAKVLDGGCGMSIWLTPEIEARVKYTGIDAQEDSIAGCRQAYPQRDYQRADLYHLPFPDACFDAVVMREVIEHVKRPPEVCAEIVRVLKPGGKFILTTPNYGNLWLHLIENLYHRFYVRTFRPFSEDMHPSKFNRKRLTELLNRFFIQAEVGSIDFGINFTAVAQKP
jgi:ubiquinone/menaquinone biosynthesis C-methylase UbiE